MEVSTELETSLSNAKTRYMLAKDQTFSATVMLNLNVSFSESVPTAGTNGLSIKVNPDFWSTLSPKQQVFLLAHETWHVCFDHMGLRGDRDPALFNIAGDYVINHMLVNDCGMEFIPGGCLDSKFKDMNTYEVYDIIKNDPAHQQMAKSFQPDIMEVGDGEPEEGEEGDDAPGQGKTGSGSGCGGQQDISRRIEDIIMKAAMQAEMSKAGDSIPGYIKQKINEIKNPELPWNVLLVNYFTERTNDDYSFAKRNRRYREVYMPSLVGEGMGAIRAYFDASGSITQKELDLQCAELRYVKELMNPSRMVLRAFSHYMGREQCFERDQDITLDADASGGTELQQVMDDIAKTNDTEVTIIFTDGDFHYPNTSHVDCDIIWVIVNNRNWTSPDNSRVIHMKVDKKYG